MMKGIVFCLFTVFAVSRAQFNDEEDDDDGMFALLKKAAANKTTRNRSGFSGGRGALILDGLDMYLTPKQKKQLYSKRSGFGAIIFIAKPWAKRQVYYDFQEGDFSELEESEIREGIALIEKYTCIDFHEKGPNNPNYIHFQAGFSGCNSLLGMKGGKQDINLSKGGCRLFGVYIHEIGHALGMIHEHQRPDRDDFVRYNPVNIEPWQGSQLGKYGTMNSFGVGYDLSSMMHYELTAFSNDGVAETLTVPNPFMKRFIGKRGIRIMSFGDVKFLNRLYKCKDKCSSPPPCPEPGYVNEDCQCVTPTSYLDESCADKPRTPGECWDIVRKGQCDMYDPDHQKFCPRACELCPRFVPGEMIPPYKCEDQYTAYPEKCKEWAAAGDCQKYPYWMNQFCTASCGKCAEGFGDCSDMRYSVASCEELHKKGECVASWLSFVKRRCQHTCRTCGIRREGRCDNRASDEDCTRRMKAGECETNAVEMFYDCPKSCNRCDFQAGECYNKPGTEEECKQKAALNFCEGGPKMHYDFAQANCPKACNNCTEEDKRLFLIPTTTTTTTPIPTTTTEAPTTTTPIPCIDKYGDYVCGFKVADGECTAQNNDGYFTRRGCRKACGLC